MNKRIIRIISDKTAIPAVVIGMAITLIGFGALVPEAARGDPTVFLGTQVTVGGTFEVPVGIDKMPNGVAGWDVTVTYPRRTMSPVRAVYNGQDCDVLAMPEPGEPAFLPQAVLCRMYIGVGEVQLLGIDLDQVLEVGMKHRAIVTVEFLALQEGSPIPNIIINRIDDDNGDAMTVNRRSSRWLLTE